MSTCPAASPFPPSWLPKPQSIVPEAFEIIDFSEIPPVDCPCGQARRALADFAAFPGTVHLTEIDQDAHAHHHQEHTEIYVILQCDRDASIELNGVEHPVKPLTTIAIPPGVVHRAKGKMKVLIICHPEFDPRDELLATSSPVVTA